MGGLPWYALPRGLLHVHEVGKDAEFGGGAGDHDYQPEVELGFGPVVFAPAFGDADDLGRHVEGGGDGREGREREAGVPRESVDLKRLSKRRSAVKVQRVGRWRELWQCAGRSLLPIEGAPVLDVARLLRCNCTKISALVSARPWLFFRGLWLVAQCAAPTGINGAGSSKCTMRWISAIREVSRARRDGW